MVTRRVAEMLALVYAITGGAATVMLTLAVPVPPGPYAVTV